MSCQVARQSTWKSSDKISPIILIGVFSLASVHYRIAWIWERAALGIKWSTKVRSDESHPISDKKYPSLY